MRMEEGQVTWCGWRRVRSLGSDGGGSGHLVRMEEGRLHHKADVISREAVRKGEDYNWDMRAVKMGM